MTEQPTTKLHFIDGDEQEVVGDLLQIEDKLNEPAARVTIDRPRGGKILVTPAHVAWALQIN